MYSTDLFRRLSQSLVILVMTVLLGACCSTLPLLPTPIKSPPVATEKSDSAHFKPTTFENLPGWRKDDVRKALPAFLESCKVLVKQSKWMQACTIAKTIHVDDLNAVRRFFEYYFVPNRVIDPKSTNEGLITGYYEPLLVGSKKRGGVFQTPLYGVPDDLINVDLSTEYPELKNMRLRGRIDGGVIKPYYTRAEITRAKNLHGKVLVWVDDPVDAFFFQVQGSGRVQLIGSNEVIRLAYANQNGWPYQSIGRRLIEEGDLKADQASAQSIKNWLKANPDREEELLNTNPSYIFFREEKKFDPKLGPLGSLGVPLTAGRSVAVDNRFIPLGVPVYLDTTEPNSTTPLQRLVMAQDTGGAIKGVVRADFFWGFGVDAGSKAGAMKQSGDLWILLPRS